MRRRKFLRVVPAAVAGAIATPVLAKQESAPAIAGETLDCAEKIVGVDFTPEQEEQALRSVNRNLDAFERLRKIDVPLDLDPALEFVPYLPGRKPAPGATPGAAEALQPETELRRHAHRRARAGAGGGRRPRDSRRALPRAAAWHSVGRKGSVRDERDPHDVGRRSVPDAGAHV
jgi:hypothetical protein